MKLRDLITNPATGRMSTSDTIIVSAFVATTLVLFWYAWSEKLTEWLFIGYITAWVTHSQASKYHSIKRDRSSVHASRKKGVDDATD